MRKPAIIPLDIRVTRTALDMQACRVTAPIPACNAAIDLRRAGARECRTDGCGCSCDRGNTWREYEEYGATGSCAGCGTCNCGCGCHCRPPEPVWHVPAFDNDDDGRLVFVWGNLLHHLVPGLYDAVLTSCTRPLAEFRIHLGERDRSVSAFENTYTNDSCNPLALCDNGCGATANCECPPALSVYIPSYAVPVMGGSA